jgi:hypothetical protein
VQTLAPAHNAVFVDEEMGRQVEAMLLNDKSHAVEWDPADLRKAPFGRRLAVAVARLTAPIL